MVAAVGLEPTRPFRATGFSYHYSFRYQSYKYYFENTLAIFRCTLNKQFRISNCLWSGLALNHIETRPYSSLIVQPAVRYRNLLRSCYYYTFNLGPLCKVSTHCLSTSMYHIKIICVTNTSTC